MGVCEQLVLKELFGQSGAQLCVFSPEDPRLRSGDPSGKWYLLKQPLAFRLLGGSMRAGRQWVGGGGGGVSVQAVNPQAFRKQGDRTKKSLKRVKLHQKVS